MSKRLIDLIPESLRADLISEILEDSTLLPMQKLKETLSSRESGGENIITDEETEEHIKTWAENERKK